MLPLVISTPGISSFPRFLTHTHSLSHTSFVCFFDFFFIFFSFPPKYSFSLYISSFFSSSSSVPTFLFSLSATFFFLPLSAAAKTLQFCSSHWICVSYSFRFIHFFFKLFFQFRDSGFLSLRLCFFLLFFCYDKIDWCCISPSSFSRAISFFNIYSSY